MSRSPTRMLWLETFPMRLNAIEGIIQNGQIRLREDIALPENATVYVIIPDPQSPASAAAHLRSPHLADAAQADDFRKKVVELPANAEL